MYPTINIGNAALNISFRTFSLWPRTVSTQSVFLWICNPGRVCNWPVLPLEPGFGFWYPQGSGSNLPLLLLWYWYVLGRVYSLALTLKIWPVAVTSLVLSETRIVGGRLESSLVTLLPVWIKVSSKQLSVFDIFPNWGSLTSQSNSSSRKPKALEGQKGFQICTIPKAEKFLQRLLVSCPVVPEPSQWSSRACF